MTLFPVPIHRWKRLKKRVERLNCCCKRDVSLLGNSSKIENMSWKKFPLISWRPLLRAPFINIKLTEHWGFCGNQPLTVFVSIFDHQQSCPWWRRGLSSPRLHVSSIRSDGWLRLQFEPRFSCRICELSNWIRVILYLPSTLPLRWSSALNFEVRTSVVNCKASAMPSRRRYELSCIYGSNCLLRKLASHLWQKRRWLGKEKLQLVRAVARIRSVLGLSTSVRCPTWFAQASDASDGWHNTMKIIDPFANREERRVVHSAAVEQKPPWGLLTKFSLLTKLLTVRAFCFIGPWLIETGRSFVTCRSELWQAILIHPSQGLSNDVSNHSQWASTHAV